MEDKLVTLAIRTYNRAQMIKNVLEENGIETMIHNLNLEQPEMAVGVRVRIKKSDLPRALKIVEEVESAWERDDADGEKRHVLISVDFADMVEHTIDFGFWFAEQMGVSVTILYVYFTPSYTISGNRDFSTYSISDSELTRRIVNQANADAENLDRLLKKRIANKELPDVNFGIEIKEGVPEDEILDYCKKRNPELVVMGTQGKKITDELIGSVTAEVIDSTLSPVFAVPVQVALRSPKQIRRVAFLTNFDQKDLIAIDKTIELCNSENTEIYFIHSAEKTEPWSEVMLAGIKSYFASQYPGIKTHYALLGSSNSPELIENYLKEKEIDLLAFNSRRKKMFSRLFNPGLAYRLVMQSDTMLFVTHV